MFTLPFFNKQRTKRRCQQWTLTDDRPARAWINTIKAPPVIITRSRASIWASRPASLSASSANRAAAKSTLLNMITGIDRPTTGEVWVNGTAVHKMNENQMAIWRGDEPGHYVPILPIAARPQPSAKRDPADGSGRQISAA